MLRTAACLCAAFALHTPARGGEPIVTLGDSLTFAYEAEFGFRINTILGSFGDGFGPEVRNWIEILRDPAFRGDHFDVGERRAIRLTIPFGSTVDLFFRHDRNWAIPGLRIAQLREFLEGEADFMELIGEIEEFAALETALGFSNFDPASDFALADFEDQVRDEAARLTLFIGGNDARGIYGTVYGGGDAGSFVEDFVADAWFILSRVRELNPELPVVLVNVPHVGITPDVQDSHPPDEEKTGRVTALLRELNEALAVVAEAHGAGYADIFEPTLRLLGPEPLCLHGLPFENSGSETGDLDFVWLDGPLSANFHPNTNAHTIIANRIIAAFNEIEGGAIASLTAEETLGGLLAKSPAEIDMPFASWLECYGLAADLDPAADADGDGLAVAVEFALGLDPTTRDASALRLAVVEPEDGPRALELAFPLRLAASARYEIRPAAAPSGTDFTPLEDAPARGADGLARATLPFATSSGLLRLEVGLLD